MIKQPVIIIAGPTASGKTDLSYQLAQQYPIEIINSDVGQFYEPLTVGTAKPSWRDHSIPHHLFDLISSPTDLSVKQYRNKVQSVVAAVHERGNLPVLVGGSFFYLHSLFFPPHDTAAKVSFSPRVENRGDVRDLWQQLQTIDADRAAAIHPNDIYRIERALALWYTTGTKPSMFRPFFDAPFNALIFLLNPLREVLAKRIDFRSKRMLFGTADESWLEEAKRLRGTPWECFLRRKKLIGYPAIFDWLERGERQEELATLQEYIAQSTRRYAKRQTVFARRLVRQLASVKSKNILQCSFVDATVSSLKPHIDVVLNKNFEVEKKNI